MTKKMMGRLALRREGNWWVAYYALIDTMEGALEMGRIAFGLAQNPQVKKVFIETMRIALEEIFKAEGMPVAEWNDPIPAPEAERSGRA